MISIGQKIGKLVLLYKLPKRKAVFKCECGKEISCFVSNVKRGNTTSCGCVWYNRVAKAFDHGLSKSRTYRIWANMKTRCGNPKASQWEWYGARGIKVCDRWKNFKNFLADMGECPEKMSIDRIDNNGNYEPGNCKWVDQKQQCLNRRIRKDSVSLK